MTIAKIHANWSTFTGQPGYTNIFVRSTAASPNPLQAFFQAITSYLPTGLVVTIPNSGEFIDEANGKMTGVWGTGTTTSSTGTGGANYAPQSGAQVKFDTGGFVNGRHVRGRMFLVPLATSVYAGAVLNSTVANAIQAAADTMRTSFTGNLVVWSRPVFELDSNGNPTEVLKRPGQVFTVTTCTCPTKPATLRSRRDA